MANIVDTDDLNQYDQETGTFTSSDSSTPGSWQSVAVLESGETKPSIFAKISKMFSNIRWLYNNKRTAGAFDSKSDTVTFTTQDASSDSSATSWTTVSQLTSGSSHATLLNRISAMMKNTRFLYTQYCNNVESVDNIIDSSSIPTSWQVRASRFIRKFIAPGLYLKCIVIEIYRPGSSAGSAELKLISSIGSKADPDIVEYMRIPIYVNGDNYIRCYFDGYMTTSHKIIISGLSSETEVQINHVYI